MNISPALRATSDGRVDLPPSGAEALGFLSPRDCNAPGCIPHARAKWETARTDGRGAVDAAGNIAPLGLRPRKRVGGAGVPECGLGGSLPPSPRSRNLPAGGGESSTPADATARDGQAARQRGSTLGLRSPRRGCCVRFRPSHMGRRAA